MGTFRDAKLTNRLQLDTNDDQLELDVDLMISEYRHASDAGRVEVCQQLRQGWKEWQGEDSLHETAYGHTRVNLIVRRLNKSGSD